MVGLYWLADHRMFRCIRRFDSTLLVLNLAALGTVAFTPFPTSVLGNHGNTTAGSGVLCGDHGPPRRLDDAALGVRVDDYRLISATTAPIRLPHVVAQRGGTGRVHRVDPDRARSRTAAECFWLLLLLIRIVLRRRYRTIFEGEPGVQ